MRCVPRIVALLLATFILATTGALPAVAEDGEIKVFKGRVTLPIGREDPTAYFVLRNGSKATRTIVGARCDCAESVSVRRTAVNEEGQWSSEAMPAMPVPAGGDVAFVPRGLFLRLMSARALTAGETVEIVLEFEDGGEVPFEATVSGG
ncbi:MAG: copper chaperone PCu(A)C [Myxococcota bacterium]